MFSVLHYHSVVATEKRINNNNKIIIKQCLLTMIQCTYSRVLSNPSRVDDVSDDQNYYGHLF